MELEFMNIPAKTFEREELYTFIGGIVVGSSWYLYFQKINIIGESRTLTDPVFLLIWLSRGMMYLYAGVMLAFRNPRAHGLINDDAEEALDIISFVSFLAKALDGAKR